MNINGKVADHLSGARASCPLQVRPEMNLIVVGAGASIEEARRANAPKEFWPPTIANFAKKLWDTPPNEFFNYWLPDYLAAQGIDPVLCQNSIELYAAL